MKTLVIYHSADFDGTLSRDAAVHWLLQLGQPQSTLVTVGWDYGQPAPDVAGADAIYMVDISVPELLIPENRERIIWIDHHKTAMQKHGDAWAGVRIDGVAACRLTWQWFQARARGERMPAKQDFVDRVVQEPTLLRMAGEYDVWDKRDPQVDTLQYGLRATPGFSALLAFQDWERNDMRHVGQLLQRGRVAELYAKDLNAAIAARAYETVWEGLTWLVINTAIGNSLTFEAAIKPHHDALMMWRHTGSGCVVSLYGSPHRPDLDLSGFAARRGGGGHRQACGFRCTWAEMEFILDK